MAGSTPVISFGDPGIARVATLGINPSGMSSSIRVAALYTGARRRLATLESLGAARTDDLSDPQVVAVVAECAAYFHVNPYRRWFGALDELIRSGLGVSYFDGTACHLDLVQWATHPAWGRISDTRVRRALAEDGPPRLRAQLAENRQISLVLCNGRQVIDQARDAGLADLRGTGVIRCGSVVCTTIRGHRHRSPGAVARVVSQPSKSFGVSAAFKHELARWLSHAHSDGHSPAEPEQHHGSRRTSSAAPISDLTAGDYLPRGLRISGRRELAAALAGWLALTIGDIGTFGRTACIRIDIDGTEVVLNGDTKRAAAEAFVRASTETPDRPWLVVTSQGGHATKVLPGPTPEPAPGWYAYLTQPGTAGQLI